MSVVSVLNYKGGVGKTTVTVNLGADLAHRGRKVLLIDLDPQSSLTFSLYRAEEWEQDLAPDKTIMHWYDSFSWAHDMIDLAGLIVTPPKVNKVVEPRGGRLDLIASHLGLVDVELDLAAGLGGTRYQTFNPDYLKVHRLLADALAVGRFREYDVILIDCPPNFNMVTRTAVVASDHILVPAKADYLSTLGISYLRNRLSKLVAEYNGVAGDDVAINPLILGVVFTMVQYAGSGLMNKLREYMAQTVGWEVPVFQHTIRESKSVFADSGEQGVPPVLSSQINPNVEYDLHQLTVEFLAKIRI
jgi:chromosome partitioning protein